LTSQVGIPFVGCMAMVSRASRAFGCHCLAKAWNPTEAMLFAVPFSAGLIVETR
jgi:hypothetical protein